MTSFSNNSQARNSSQKRILKQRLSRRGSFCRICKKQMSIDRLTLDHIIPLVAGGTWDLSNLQLACTQCNREKADKYVDPWSLI